MERQVAELGIAGASPCVLVPVPAPTPSFVVSATWLDDELPVISVTGELDMATAPALEGPLRALCFPATGAVIVDLALCIFMDLRGLRVLLEAQEQLERWHHPLVLVVGKPSVLRIFQVTRVDGLFEIYPTLQAAARDYGHRA